MQRPSRYRAFDGLAVLIACCFAGRKVSGSRSVSFSVFLKFSVYFLGRELSIHETPNPQGLESRVLSVEIVCYLLSI